LRNSATTQTQQLVELSKRNFIKKTKHRTPTPQNSHIPKYSEFKTNTKVTGKVKTTQILGA
jgi:ribosomal protein L39E